MTNEERLERQAQREAEQAYEQAVGKNHIRCTRIGDGLYHTFGDHVLGRIGDVGQCLRA